jgi:NNP family nitrate/nitrite transporter-like MFS transporter
MPWVLAALASLGATKSVGWRVSMMLPAALMLAVAMAYWKLTQDSPMGDYRDLRAAGIEIESGKKGGCSQAPSQAPSEVDF